jgi:hypothetical protein
VADERQVQAFLRALDGVEQWVGKHFSTAGQPAAVLRMAQALKQYIRQSRRYAQGSRADGAELDRRLRKIDRAYFTLWESQFDQ